MYALELQDEKGLERQIALLGFRRIRLVLLAPYTDKALMRDILAYEWSNRSAGTRRARASLNCTGTRPAR